MNQEEINKSWKKFNILFWISLLVSVPVYILLLPFNPIQSPEQIYVILGGILIICFVILCGSLGYYAYRFSGKRKNLIVGFLGVLTVMPVIGHFGAVAGYFLVRYFKETSEKTMGLLGSGEDLINGNYSEVIRRKKKMYTIIVVCILTFVLWGLYDFFHLWRLY